MKLVRSYAISAFLPVLLVLASMPAGGQEPERITSLGEVARQLKAERERERQKPVAVYTNDNLPSKGSMGTGTRKATGGERKKEATAGKGTQAGSQSEKHDEKYFRSKAEKIRSRMDFHRRQLAVLQQQLGLAKVQYYPNPQKSLEQESTPAFQSDPDKLRSQIAVAQKAIADDQKAMDDLQEELRREGGGPGWIRQPSAHLPVMEHLATNRTYSDAV